jgi:hypothetical protein
MAALWRAKGLEPVLYMPSAEGHSLLYDSLRKWRQYARDPTMLQRNLLYTGVTRGKRLVVLVGQKKAIAIAVRNLSGRRRWSKLEERLRIGAPRASAIAPPRAEVRWRWRSRRVTCGLVVLRRLGMRISSRSRGAGVSAVRRSLIVANCLTRSAAQAGLS